MTIYNLGDRQITAAATDLVITEGVSASGVAQGFIDRLAGMSSVSLQASFVYGSGGTTCAVIVQTSFDQGQSWIDVCRFNFTTANGKKVANIAATGGVAPAAVTALGDEGVGPAVLGDRLRAKITTTGTYSGNTSISVRASVR